MIERNLLRHGLVYWVGRMAARSVSFLTIPLYTTYLHPSDWGALAILLITCDLAMLIVTCQLQLAIPRFWALQPSEEERRRLAGLSLLIPILLSSCLFLPIYICPTPLASALGLPKTAHNLLRITLLTAQLAVLLTMVQTEMRLRDESKLYAAIEVLQNFSAAAFSIFFLVVLRRGIQGVILGQLSAFSLLLTLLLPRTLKRVAPPPDFAVIKQVLNFSLPLVFSSVAMGLVHNVDRYLIQALRGLTDVGLYSVGYKLGTLVNILVLGPFLILWEPKSFQIAQRQDASLRYGVIFSYLLAMLVFVAVALTGVSREIVRLMTEQKYWTCEQVVPVVAWSYVFFSLDTVVRMGLLVHHKTKTLTAIVFITFSVNVLGNIILIPMLGMLGAAWATLVAFALLLLLDSSVALRYLPIHFQWRRIAAVASAAALLLCVMRAANGLDMWTAVLAKGSALVAYPLLLGLFGFFAPGRIFPTIRRPQLK